MTDLMQIKIKREDYPRLVAHGVAGQAVHEAMTNLLNKVEQKIHTHSMEKRL